MTTAYILLCFGWLISICAWLFTIFNKRARDNMEYVYPLLAILVIYIVICVYSLILMVRCAT